MLVLGQFADEFHLDNAQFLLAPGVGRHGRTQGGNQRQGNGGGAVDLQQGSDFRASFGIDVGAFFDVEQDDGMGAGYGHDAADAGNGFGAGGDFILRQLHLYGSWTQDPLMKTVFVGRRPMPPWEDLR